MKELTFNGVSFNAEFYKGKSEEQFIKEQKHVLPEVELKQAYALINPSNANDTKATKELPKPKHGSSNSGSND